MIHQLEVNFFYNKSISYCKHNIFLNIFTNRTICFAINVSLWMLQRTIIFPNVMDASTNNHISKYQFSTACNFSHLVYVKRYFLKQCWQIETTLIAHNSCHLCKHSLRCKQTKARTLKY